MFLLLRFSLVILGVGCLVFLTGCFLSGVFALAVLL